MGRGWLTTGGQLFVASDFRCPGRRRPYLGSMRLAESETLRPSVTLSYWLSGPSPFQSQF